MEECNISRREPKHDIPRDELVTFQQQLGTDVKIGFYLGISNVAVGRLRLRHGIPRFAGDLLEDDADPSPSLALDVNRAIMLYNEGWSTYEISLECIVPPSAVRLALMDAGVVLRDGRPGSGRDAPNWAGGRYTTEEGYVMVYCPDHPFAQAGGYVREHRLVMEQHLGRLLDPDEDVHHRDGNRQNNHISNLQLISHGNHRRLHAELQKQSCTMVQSVELRAPPNELGAVAQVNQN